MATKGSPPSTSSSSHASPSSLGPSSHSPPHFLHDAHSRPRLSPKDLNIGGRATEYFSLPSELPTGGSAASSPGARGAFEFGKVASASTTPGASHTGAGDTARKFPATTMTEGLPLASSSSPSFNLSSLPTSLSFAPTLPASIRTHRPSPFPRAAVTSRHTPFTAPEFISLLHSSSSSPASAPLVLDIRTHTAYTSSRVTQSLNICVPSTLLRRPAYDLSRIGDSLTGQDKIEWERWSKVEAVVVLDGEGSQLVQGGGVASLLDKFERAGFKGRLGWVAGGFTEVSRELKGVGGKGGWLSYGQAQGSGSTASLGTLPTAPSLKHGRPVLQVRDLPVAAFQQASTSAFTHAGLPSASHGLGSFSLNRGASSRGSGGSSRGGLGKRRKGPTGTTAESPDVSPSLSSEGGIVTGTTLTPGGESSGEKRMASNPFFDNIRQNSEALSLSRSLANLAPVDLPPVPTHLVPMLPPFLSSLISLAPLERAQILARQYYELELAERERLEGTLAWHANEQGKEDEDGESGYKKFGISAGVELGNLNRFKNIFPYDHARVRLQVPNASSTDYINASHISTSTSHTRYIASQGPLPTTYDDFWNMCQQEEVGVIIMLTNLREGGRDKCGRYWMCPGDCLWDVTVDREGGEEEEEEVSGGGGGFFATAKEKPIEETSATIRRTLHLKNKVDGTERTVRHIQYCAWPDFDIPAKPSDVVHLVREVNSAQQEYLAERGSTGGVRDPPVVAHCSAGVGRTGVFIMVSNMLEKLRQDRLAQLTNGNDDTDDDMEIDVPSPRNSFFPVPSRAASTIHLESGSETEASDSEIPEPSPSSITSDTSLLAHDLRASTLNPTSSPAPSTPATSYESTSHIPLSPSTHTDSDPAVDSEPIFKAVNELREARMSMVANYRQYVCVVECTLVGLLEELETEYGAVV